jgi:predicted DNA binding protein
MSWNKKTKNYRNIVLFIVIGIFIFSTLQQLVFANHGKEIILKLNDAQFFLPSGKNIQQVKLTTTYSVSDSATISKEISGTMKIFSSNGTLIKTTSIPNGFKVDKTGFQQFVTSLPNSTIQNITTVVLFTDLNKTAPLSNSINTDLILNKTQ